MCYTKQNYNYADWEVLPLKYWRGYLTAAIIAFFSWMLITFARSHAALIDMVYPYVTRMVQGFLAEWSGGVDFCVWQLVAMLMIVAIVATLVLMVVFRWNPIQWFGWITAVASLLFFLHTGIYGLNSYAGSIADDIRLEKTEYTLGELKDATIYYRDQANALANQIPRDSSGNPVYPEFEVLAQQAEEGFHNLVYTHSYSIFAGSTLPVKKLGWAEMYTSMGITGFTMSLTGEAAVNPQIPVVSMPFTMCHEMAHRMSIAVESDANMAAFLACDANSSVEYRYSGYFMAYRYCYNAMATLGSVEAKQAMKEVSSGVNDNFYNDMVSYSNFFAQNRDEKATEVANTVNDGYIKANGDERGVASYGEVCDLFVSWHIQQVVIPSMGQEEVSKFDPYDENQVFPTEPQPTENTADE